MRLPEVFDRALDYKSNGSYGVDRLQRCGVPYFQRNNLEHPSPGRWVRSNHRMFCRLCVLPASFSVMTNSFYLRFIGIHHADPCKCIHLPTRCNPPARKSWIIGGSLYPARFPNSRRYLPNEVAVSMSSLLLRKTGFSTTSLLHSSGIISSPVGFNDRTSSTSSKSRRALSLAKRAR